MQVDLKNVDWKTLPFGYTDTDYNVRCYYRNGEWGKIEVSSSKDISIHMAATCLHYGQEGFEGLKAYTGKDGKVRIFRVDENAKRMQNTANRVLMAVPPVELFREMVSFFKFADKEMIVDETFGIRFKMNNTSKTIIPVTALSSGEKHVLLQRLERVKE